MKEFMFYIRNSRDAKKNMTAEKRLEFVKKCEIYIENLKSRNKLVAAQPLISDAIVVSKTGNNWNERVIDPDNEVDVGYYHIRASDFQEAVRIAKENPEFEYVPSASIEVRTVKTSEAETGYTYPAH
jgi:hypothetical protein